MEPLCMSERVFTCCLVPLNLQKPVRHHRNEVKVSPVQMKNLSNLFRVCRLAAVYPDVNHGGRSKCRHTSKPSKTKAPSSEPSSLSGGQLGRVQPTLIFPAVTASYSKYHFPLVTTCDLSGLNTLSAQEGHGFDKVAVKSGSRNINMVICDVDWPGFH